MSPSGAATATWWFPVPGMYGGFSYRLEAPGVEARLVSESWCRVVGGSGQRHEITSAGSHTLPDGCSTPSCLKPAIRMLVCLVSY